MCCLGNRIPVRFLADNVNLDNSLNLRYVTKTYTMFKHPLVLKKMIKKSAQNLILDAFTIY